MGTDIHGVVQHRYGGGKWWTEGEVPDARNYTLFAALAGVRNGYGFAGVYRHEPLIPISEPRGFPEDIELIDGDSIKKSWEWCEAKEDYHPVWMGDHSHTWLTVEEILSWDGWDKNLVQGGYISREEYEKWDHEGAPENGWSGMISGPSIVNAIEGEHEPEGWTHIKVSWSRPLRESCEGFLAWCKYAETLGEQVRIVIGFDS